MASASNMLGGAGASSAADRLAAKGQPSGKAGSPFLTVKLRTQFDKVREDRDISWPEWLDEQGYGLGDNTHVYKK